MRLWPRIGVGGFGSGRACPEGERGPTDLRGVSDSHARLIWAEAYGFGSARIRAKGKKGKTKGTSRKPKTGKLASDGSEGRRVEIPIAIS